MNQVEKIVADRKNLLAGFGGRKPPAPEWFEHAIADAPERTFVDVRGAAIETLTWGQREKPGAPRPKNIYDTLEQALARFRFAPDQDCANLFIADWIARSSLRQFRHADGSVGWTWRFDPHLWMGFLHGYPNKDLLAGQC